MMIHRRPSKTTRLLIIVARNWAQIAERRLAHQQAIQTVGSPPQAPDEHFVGVPMRQRAVLIS